VPIVKDDRLIVEFPVHVALFVEIPRGGLGDKVEYLCIPSQERPHGISLLAKNRVVAGRQDGCPLLSKVPIQQTLFTAILKWGLAD